MTEVEGLLADFVVPSFFIQEKTRMDAFGAGCTFIKEVHKEYGFDLAAV
jgi:hypothetical protein